MKPEELQEIIYKHVKWLNDEPGGERWSCPWNCNLSGANMIRADLRGADLSGANLRGADLREADLRGAKEIPEYVSAVTSILPSGDLIGWKKLGGGLIAKLLIPADAKRGNATGRKCRAEWVKVLEIWDGESAVEMGYSKRGEQYVYRVGETFYPDNFDDNRWDECSNGVHFFITRWEAENY